MTGTRELSFAARSSCQRVRWLTAWGTTGTAAATRFGLDEPDEVSPFAAAAGNQFERRLLADNAAALHDVYHAQVGVRIRTVTTIADSGRHDRNGVDHDALAGTLDWLRGDHEPGDALAQAQLVVNVAGADRIVVPDLVVRVGSGWRVAEIKAYLTESGFSDERRLGDAVAQAAFGVVGLRQAGFDVAGVVDVVRQDRFARPVITTAAVEVWETHLAELAATANEIRWLSEPPDTIDAVQQQPAAYEPGCEGRCGLAPMCRAGR